MRSLVAAIPLALVLVISASPSEARRGSGSDSDAKIKAELAALRSDIRNLVKAIKPRDLPPSPPAAAPLPELFWVATAVMPAEAVAKAFPSGLVTASLTPSNAPAEKLSPTLDEIIMTARAYLIDTAHAGGTMSRLGRDRAIGLLHPDFAVRLAAAVHEAREIGMSDVGAYSAYRPPSFGVGGFRDKYLSLHSYGLAVDMHGIGRPGSSKARLWHRIAARNGVACVYGPNRRSEWNHCQGTKLRVATNALRKTITSRGPTDPEAMWAAARNIVVPAVSMVASLGDLPLVERTRIRRHHARHHSVHHRYRHHRRYA